MKLPAQTQEKYHQYAIDYFVNVANIEMQPKQKKFRPNITQQPVKSKEEEVKELEAKLSNKCAERRGLDAEITGMKRRLDELNYVSILQPKTIPMIYLPKL
jgi:hypothetical protein